ncbi:MAG: alanyl-tRNA editing protein [Lachnospiraceae bacterium]|nr:alanyl-tRNA editing protein [Lachnospiraceae bacterium]
MTVKLYDTDPYGIEFDAKVTGVTEVNSKRGYILDRTLFFPEEGGQSCDKGTLNNLNVTAVNIKNDTVIHFVDGFLNEGDSVHGVIDWDRRFRNMQCHSAEHIFTGLVHNIKGFNNVGFHLSDNTATMDYDGFLSSEEIAELEVRANVIIIENRPIKAEYPDSETLKTLEYRSKKEIEGPVRIVTVEGVDVCACCAPHVRSTGEIGLFKVISSEKYKGGVRIHYLAGFRAIEDYEERLSALRDISAVLSAKPGAEADTVRNMLDDNKKLKFELVNVTNRYIETKIRNEYRDGSRFFLYIGGADEISGIDYAAKVIRGLVDSFALFLGDDESGYKFIIESDTTDTGDLLDKLKKRYNAKCGGKNGSFRGSMAISETDIKRDFSTMESTFGAGNE